MKQRAKPTYHRVINCVQCGVEVRNATPVQRYCQACSTERHAERQRKWSRAHGYTPKMAAAQKKRRQIDRDGILERGRIASKKAAEAIAWLANENPDLRSLVRVRFPFSYSLSKNRIWANSPKGHVFLRRESRSARDQLCLLLKAAMQTHGVTFHEGKVWLDILVQKPNHRGDAINVIDLVCDAAKDAIGIDDRWFSIRRLDWQVVKDNPAIFIGIGQEISEPERICSACGQAKPHHEFKSHRRICVDCARKPKPIDALRIAPQTDFSLPGVA